MKIQKFGPYEVPMEQILSYLKYTYWDSTAYMIAMDWDQGLGIRPLYADILLSSYR